MTRSPVLTLLGVLAVTLVSAHAPSPASARQRALGRHAIIRVLAPSTAACVDDRFSATFELVVSDGTRHFPSPLWFACSERRIVRADALLVIETTAFHGGGTPALEVRAPRAATRRDLTHFDVLSLLGRQRSEIEAGHGRAMASDRPGDWTQHRAGLVVLYEGERCVAVRVPVSSDVTPGRLDAWLGLTPETLAQVSVTRSGPYAEVRPR